MVVDAGQPSGRETAGHRSHPAITVSGREPR